MENKLSVGHLSAIITIIIWGTTYISTKILLNGFSPIEILFFRFVIGIIALKMIYPYRLKFMDKQHELLFACAGLCGVTLYYLLENIALTFTLASNVGVISAIVPFFTAILIYLFLKNEPLRMNFFIGFIVALLGIFLISFNGSTNFQLNPVGDLLAVAATLIWAIYSVLTRKISSYGYNTIQATRRVFFYGILFMIPALFLFDFKLDLERFVQPVYLFNLLFLGLGASALCFVSWNFAIKKLGAIKTSIYIYLVPIITVITAMIVLHEPMTWMAALGILLTLTGLFISEAKINTKRSKVLVNGLTK
ncbi:DMT family transporter [Metabacillus niabensis]|uniref:Drug/metabolite transporter (DMT)-like permease n=1 Tax=Metabacillus niabensis TaxID=324854 RepID=A0ABT9YZD7_9BACI|nr:DMT family transporter [Metabacillus niabensis]MDQ0225355.1 drug/metabolite transporter (DMT)-like permease [Metabacillus niabensis]